MALKKSQLYSSLWQSCDELRGGMDASQYKDYVLTLLFMKYVSDKYAGSPDALIEVPAGGGFADMVKLKGDKEIGDKINKIIGRLAEANDLKGVIGLPANLFYGTGIPACILVIDREHAHARTGIFVVDASKGFLKDGNKNRLRARDIHRIVDVFNRQIEQTRYSRMVPVAEIASPANDYNLNIPRYIDSSEPEDLHDLDAHLNGGIPNRDIDAMDAYWKVFPSLRDALFQDVGRKGYCEARVETPQVKATILAHGEFKAYADRVAAVFKKWRKAHEPRIEGLKEGANPKELIHELSEDLLARFADLPLLDRYDVYQRLMDYWDEVMQDDVYLIAADTPSPDEPQKASGWIEAARPRGIIEDREKKIKETPDLTIKRRKYKMDLIPPPLIVARYFAEEQAAIEALRARQETAAREFEEFVEEHTGEEGLLEDATNDKGKVTKASLNARITEIKKTPVIPAKAGIQETDQELATLRQCQQLLDLDAAASKKLKDAIQALDEAVFAHYAKLSEAEIKTLLVEDKWLANLQAAVEGEVQRLTQQLAGRVKELEERYARPLPEVESEVEVFSAKVEGHLKKMGLAWG